MNRLHGEEQRRAIEAIAEHLEPVAIPAGQKVYVDDKEVFFLGVSREVGQGKRGTFAVFGTGSGTPKEDMPYRIDGCVLLRDPNEEEKRGRGCLLIFEALGLSSAFHVGKRAVVLKRKKQTSEYVVTIG